MIKKLKKWYRKKLTLIFAPERGGRSFHITITYPFIFFISLFCVAVVAAAIHITGIYVSYHETLSSNRELRERKSMYAEKTDDALDLLSSIRNIETRLTSMLGMESPRNVIENYPVGGPDPDLEIPSELDSLFELNLLEANLNELKREAWNQQRSAHEIEGFLERKKDMLLSTPAIWPAYGYVTSGFGNRTHPITGRREFHRGLDIYSSLGNKAPVRATARGRVVLAGWAGKAGQTVVVDHGSGFSSRYMHLSSTEVEQGDEVEQGQTLGHIGRTGRTTGNHLHYEVWHRGQPVNPGHYVRGR